MLALIILSVFIFIVILIIFIEYRNEKRYQAKRHEKRDKPIQPQNAQRTIITETPKETRTKKTTPPPSHKEETKVAKKLPLCNYPKFTHARLLEMGLSDEEAKEFVSELIPQIEIQIPLIEKAIQAFDFHQMERLTHSIKGSAANLGTGGVSDLLNECNTYLKTGTDIDIAKSYLKHLIYYTQNLKAQYA